MKSPKEEERILATNLLWVIGTTPIGLHYNLNRFSDEYLSKLEVNVVDLGDKDVDIVAEQCRIRLKDEGLEDMQLILDTIQEIIKEK